VARTRVKKSKKTAAAAASAPSPKQALLREAKMLGFDGGCASPSSSTSSATSPTAPGGLFAGIGDDDDDDDDDDYLHHGGVNEEDPGSLSFLKQWRNAEAPTPSAGAADIISVTARRTRAMSVQGGPVGVGSTILRLASVGLHAPLATLAASASASAVAASRSQVSGSGATPGPKIRRLSRVQLSQLVEGGLRSSPPALPPKSRATRALSRQTVPLSGPEKQFQQEQLLQQQRSAAVSISVSLVLLPGDQSATTSEDEDSDSSVSSLSGVEEDDA
jgi:hypothetical protein